MKKHIKAIMLSKGYTFIGSVAGLPSTSMVPASRVRYFSDKMLIFKKPGAVKYIGIKIIPKSKGGGFKVYKFIAPYGYRPRAFSVPVSGTPYRSSVFSTYTLRMMSL